MLETCNSAIKIQVHKNAYKDIKAVFFVGILGLAKGRNASSFIVVSNKKKEIKNKIFFGEHMTVMPGKTDFSLFSIKA